jgi:hypothetical protein
MLTMYGNVHPKKPFTMKNLTTLATLLLLHMSVFAQFQLRYSTPNYDWPAALDFDRKEGYIIAGQTLLGTWYPSLLRVDNNGTPLWSYTYNQPGIDEHFWDVVGVNYNSDAYAAAVGNADGIISQGLGTDEYFLLVNDNGQPLAARRFITPGTDVAQHIENIKHPVYGNGFIVTGYSVFQDQDVNVLITDKGGNLKKSAVYHSPLNQKPTHIEVMEDGGFIIVGETQLNQTCDKKDVNVLVIRINSDLKVLWSYTFDFTPEGATSDDRAYSVQEDPNGEIQIAGTSRLYINNVYDHDEPFQFHLKKDGSPVWLLEYMVDSYPSADVTSLITKKTDLGIIHVLSGRTHQTFEALLFETDENGKPTWGRTYPPTYSLNSTNAEDLTENELKGYSFTGRNFNAVSPSTAYDIQLVKTDANGKTGAPCEKEVTVIPHRVKVCQEKIDFTFSTMRELRISTDHIVLDLKVNKCESNQTTSLDAPVISPNPAETTVDLTGYEEGSLISIYDAQGVIKKKTSYSSKNKLDVSDLPGGVYIIEVTTANGEVNKHRFIKK